MKKFEAALDIVIKQFGKDIITEKRFVSVLADYNAFYDTPVIRDIIIKCIQDGFMQELYSISSRKSFFGESEKKYSDVKKCVTRYKGSIKNGLNKNLSEAIIDLIVSKVVDGYNGSYAGIKPKTFPSKRCTHIHYSKKHFKLGLFVLFCAFSSYYCYFLKQAIRHDSEIDNERQMKEFPLSFKGITLGNNIENVTNGIGWYNGIYGYSGVRCENDWYKYEEVKLTDCKYFTFYSFLNDAEVRGTVRAYKNKVYEIELDRTKVEGIENDYIKKYGEPSTNTVSLALSFFNISPYVLNWKFKNGTITITPSTIRYYKPETLKLIETYKKEKEEEVRQKVLQEEREDSLREAEQIKEQRKREREAKIKQYNDI